MGFQALLQNQREFLLDNLDINLVLHFEVFLLRVNIILHSACRVCKAAIRRVFQFHFLRALNPFYLLHFRLCRLHYEVTDSNEVFLLVLDLLLFEYVPESVSVLSTPDLLELVLTVEHL